MTEIVLTKAASDALVPVDPQVLELIPLGVMCCIRCQKLVITLTCFVLPDNGPVPVTVPGAKAPR